MRLTMAEQPRRHPAAERAQSAQGEKGKLIAYCLSPAPALRLVPADRHRSWMDATRQHFANRCLPLLIANQAGWFLLNSHRFRATWDGGEEIASLELEYLSGEPPYPATTHFGHGILTWHIPYLFRTPPGWNLWARGPSNWPKDGAVALEGIVESDWSVATFTMNWKLTTPGRPVIFDVDEPLCMLVPQRRGELEEFEPEIRAIESDPELNTAYREWTTSRAEFLTELKVPESEAAKRAWEKHYFQGKAPDGSAAGTHQTKLQLKGFREQEGS
jgi:hypothetical protein